MTRSKQGVTVMGYIWRTLNAQDIPWVMAWLQGEPDGMHVGVLLSLEASLNRNMILSQALGVTLRALYMNWLY